MWLPGLVGRAFVLETHRDERQTAKVVGKFMKGSVSRPVAGSDRVSSMPLGDGRHRRAGGRDIKLKPDADLRIAEIKRHISLERLSTAGRRRRNYLRRWQCTYSGATTNSLAVQRRTLCAQSNYHFTFLRFRSLEKTFRQPHCCHTKPSHRFGHLHQSWQCTGFSYSVQCISL